MVRRKLISGEEMLALMDFKKKKPVVTNITGYAESAELLTDHNLYMIWRDAILATGHTPTRYLNRPKTKELEAIRVIYANFVEKYEAEAFPYFLNTIFANFENLKDYINKHRGGYMLFEVHMMGMLQYQLPYVFMWFEQEPKNA